MSLLKFCFSAYTMLHAAGRRFFRDVLHHTVRTRFLEGASGLEGGFVLACNHPSHLDPIMVSILVRRKIHWMARIEFYRSRWSSVLLNLFGAFPVDRQGLALAPMRRAISLAKAGRVVGICPEGETRRDHTSVLRWGAVKRGMGLIAQRSGRPVVPCVVLGTEALLKFGVYRMSKPCCLWVACGDPIYAPQSATRREGRRLLAEKVESAMRRLHADLRRDIANSWARKRRFPLIEGNLNDNDCARIH